MFWPSGELAFPANRFKMAKTREGLPEFLARRAPAMSAFGAPVPVWNEGSRHSVNSEIGEAAVLLRKKRAFARFLFYRW